ncbi:MAG: motility-associated protein [Pseudomonadota bacterium]
MAQVVGFFIVLIVVIGGLLVSGGPAVLSALPFELGLIGGAALGTLLIANSASVAVDAIKGFGRAIKGPRYDTAAYTSLLIVMFDLSRRARSGGIVAIEADIEAPDQSALFKAHPQIKGDPWAVDLITDSFRLMALDPAARQRVGDYTDEAIGAIVDKRQRAVSALVSLSDALPALGIVAAVLGIIKTMGVIDQSPAILGEMIAAALLGTFLGVFLAYGLVGPLASRFGQIVEEETHFLDTIRQLLIAFSQNVAPRTAIELARASLPGHVRPDLQSLDTALTQSRFPKHQAAA